MREAHQVRVARSYTMPWQMAMQRRTKQFLNRTWPSERAQAKRLTQPVVEATTVQPMSNIILS